MLKFALGSMGLSVMFSKSSLRLHQGTALSTLLFIIVLEVLSEEIGSGFPKELFCADEFALVGNLKGSV